ncbi:MAG: hypothetical protein IM613_15755 [Cytophagales bacterium]|jgi:hypothetical protein|nr:hypothetical protein [Cytophagales bacterium]MCA6420005.1 hypothetical protein [Cytophagales bacterium]MCA6427242.1 hypothetical protein [Cytophagales bacterium]MCA6430887.1 hypothetical protein [Cytophagales bacterium]
MERQISWTFGVIFLIVGLLGIYTAPAEGVAYLFLGLFLIPPILDSIGSKINFKITTVAKYLIAVGGLVLITSLQRTTDPNFTQTTDTNSPLKKDEEEPKRLEKEIHYDYITNGEFLAAISEAYLDEASTYFVDSDQKALDRLIEAKSVFYLKPNIHVDIVQEISNGYDKVEFRLKGDRNTLWTRREAIGGSKGKEISKEDYKDSWPFTVEKGILRCIEIKVSSLTIHPIVLEVNGKNYAINGAAKNWAKQNGYSDSDEIWNARGSIGLIIEDGIKICE